jgi:predicted nicotinamide N-methyase
MEGTELVCNKMVDVVCIIKLRQRLRVLRCRRESLVRRCCLQRIQSSSLLRTITLKTESVSIAASKPGAPPLTLTSIRIDEPSRLDLDFPDRAVKCDLWAYVWGSSLLFAELLNTLSFSGLRVLEIGAGSGMCGIVAAKRGASLLLTDVAEESLVMAHRNSELNDVTSQVSYRLVNWYKADDFVAAECQGFDVLIGSDVLFMGGAVKPVINLIGNMVRDQGTALIAGPGRCNLEAFEDELYEAGFLPRVHVLNNLAFAEGKIMKKFVLVEVHVDANRGKRTAGAVIDNTSPFSTKISNALDLLRQRHEAGAQKIDGYAYTV